ncbi:MAG TPA: PAS domain S-box protein [Rhodanobacteraceae bacterium]|nr:PAS domain S-box protein [Rhodanobacteraceae bacterium]
MSSQTASMDSVASLRTWFDIAPDAMIAVNQEGRIVLANAQAENLFGYEHDGLCNVSLEELVPAPLRHAHSMHRSRYMASPRLRPMGIGYELMGVKRDGQQFPVEIGLSPISIGDEAMAIASVRDISETRRVRQALERADRDMFVVQIGRLVLESNDYEQAIRRSPELVASALKIPAVAILSTDWRRSNLHMRAATGLSVSSAEALASIFADGQFIRRFFVDGEQTAIIAEEMQGEDFEPVRSALAKMNFQDVALVPLFGRHEPMGILAALAAKPRSFDRDKVSFLQSVANLLAAAVQRSRSEEQLAHAQKLEAVGQLTGGIAHDFNNLLTVISGNLQLLEADLPESERQEVIDSALRAVARGSDLTRRLLAFARRQPLQPRPVVPKPLLEELGHMLRRTLGEAVAVEVDCPADVPDVYADPNELDTALVNLALNARDAMPRGGCLSIAGREITVDADDKVWQAPPGRYVCLEVSDTGTGMSPEVRSHALEPFFTTKEIGKGSGLGLSMVYGFVTQSGGAMTLDSRLGYGTRVKLLLPVANPGHARNVADRPASNGPVAGSDETVLVVEDEMEVRNIAVRFLRAIGYNVIPASSAREALEMLSAQNDVDLLFSDVVLGSGMNGIELAQEARRMRPQLAVLLTSGYPGTGSRQHDPESTGFELLRKPYRREELASAIRRALDHA